MSENISFNLVDEPWICVLNEEGKLCAVSLLELFEKAPHIKCLANDLPTQDFAILRVLLAILQRAVSPALYDDDVPAKVWGRLWNASELPMDEIREYLGKWHDRFDLFDGEKPFMQVAGLQMLNEKMRGSGVWKIIADVPDGAPLFSLRSAKETVSLSFAEAARWLVHAQAYDTSGIKSATAGDPLVRDGSHRYSPKGNIGLGWAGRIAGIYFEGDTLRETLLLNFVVRDTDNRDLFRDDDKPSWEKEGGDANVSARVPFGRADLYTWQLRKVRLIPKEGRVVDVILTYGNLLESKKAFGPEPMTAWKCDGDKKTDVYRPFTHESGRALWRGLDSLFGDALTSDKPHVLKPDLVDWLSHLASDNGGRRLDWEWTFKAHAVGITYLKEKNYSVIVDVVDDHLKLSPFLLSKEGEPLVALAKECALSGAEAVRALGRLADNLYLASGCRSVVEGGKGRSSLRRDAERRGFSEVGSRFRSWLAGLGESSNIEAERDEWRKGTRETLKHIADDLIKGVGPAAIAGAPVKDKEGKTIGWMTASKAESLFNSRLRKALPLEKDVETKKEAR